jgi:hypothetical protein
MGWRLMFQGQLLTYCNNYLHGVNYIVSIFQQKSISNFGESGLETILTLFLFTRKISPQIEHSFSKKENQRKDSKFNKS